MNPIEPRYTVDLFPGISAALHDLLKGLSAAEWSAPTACAGWSVHDVAAHLLGGNLGRLAPHRARLLQDAAAADHWQALFALMDQTSRAFVSWRTFDELVTLINRFNAEWIEVARALETERLISYLELTDAALYGWFQALPPAEMAQIGVAWAGEAQSANWFDMAREYTEKWHHQQHIRDAVNRPGLKERHWFFPVLDAFMRALPHAYRAQSAAEGTAIVFHIMGNAGGDWSLRRQDAGWQLYTGRADNAVATAALDQEVAWRLFTNGMSREAAREKLVVTGDETLAVNMLNMVSIMA